jgi:hypothetical protein
MSLLRQALALDETGEKDKGLVGAVYNLAKEAIQDDLKRLGRTVGRL